MSFSTLINCMDGRVQTSCNAWMQKRFGAEHVDTITAPGPVKILATGDSASLIDNARISVEKHSSQAIVIAAHPECAGNPEDRPVQEKQLELAVAALKKAFPQVEIVGIWVELNGTIEELLNI